MTYWHVSYFFGSGLGDITICLNAKFFHYNRAKKFISGRLGDRLIGELVIMTFREISRDEFESSLVGAV